MSVTAEMDRDVHGTGAIPIRDYGDEALLLEFDSTAEVLAWTDALRQAELPGVLDIVPASRTVLIKLADPRYQAPTRQRLGSLRTDADPTQGRHRPPTAMPTSRSTSSTTAPDLDEVARLTGSDAR